MTTGLPVSGSKWVHRDTLTLATVLNVDANAGFVSYAVNGLAAQGVCETSCWHEEYLPNEPVSLGLLERFGWVAYKNTAIFFSRDDRDVGLGDFVEWFASDGGASYVASNPWYRRELAPLKDTADVLRLMRTFNLEVKNG